MTGLALNLAGYGIAAVAWQRHAQLDVLGFSDPGNDPGVADALHALRRHLAEAVAIAVGGAARGDFRDAIQQTKAHTAWSLKTLRPLLRRLRSS